MATRTLEHVYPDWPQHAARLARSVLSLSTAELALSAGPDHAPVWALAAHVAGARVYWLCGVFEEPGAERAPFVDLASGFSWEDDPATPRSGVELAGALDASWSIVADVLARWTPDTLGAPRQRTLGGVTSSHTRASVLNRLFTHDAFHAGEISQVLGANGLPAIDLWRASLPVGAQAG